MKQVVAVAGAILAPSVPAAEPVSASDLAGFMLNVVEIFVLPEQVCFLSR